MGRQAFRISGAALSALLRSAYDFLPDDFDLLFSYQTESAKQSNEYEFMAQSARWAESPEGAMVFVTRLETPECSTPSKTNSSQV
jgi:hypothetical protein